MNQDRRHFLQGLASVSVSTSVFAASAAAATMNNETASSTYLGTFRAEKIAKPRIAIIGVGQRGWVLIERLALIEHIEIVAICDLFKDRADYADAWVRQHGHQPALYVDDENAWRTMLRDVRPDAVLIATPWQLHATMAIATMEADAHAFVEVPLAETIDDMWKIIAVAEQRKKHCMMMENCNYGREEMLYLNMVRRGLLGELLHGEAAYIHELRFQMEHHDSTGSWRTFKYAQRNGNLYPTHGLGPIAQYMNIARSDDLFKSIVSYSSPSRARQLYAQKSSQLSDPEFKQLKFICGDINTSIIKTDLGRTIMVQWDENSPRPYSRHNLIQGTKGVLAGFPNRMAIEGFTDSYEEWTSDEAFERIAAQFEHPLWLRLGDQAKKIGGHGGMDFIMLQRIVDCLRSGDALDQTLYEGAFWSAVGPLSERSIAEQGAPQLFPDFTRGQWRNTPPLKVIA